MKKILYKWFWAWQSEEEEAWLNRCSSLGLQLSDVSFIRYAFDEGSPNAYRYRLELLENLPDHPESIAYIRFLEETGVEMIGRQFRWVYLRKRTDQGPFDLFSDLDSKIRHLDRILKLLVPILFLEVSITLINLSTFLSGRSQPILDLSILPAAVALLILYGVIRIVRKRSNLVKERKIRE